VGGWLHKEGGKDGQSRSTAAVRRGTGSCGGEDCFGRRGDGALAVAAARLRSRQPERLGLKITEIRAYVSD
jgi:hypothetical protein